MANNTKSSVLTRLLLLALFGSGIATYVFWPEIGDVARGISDDQKPIERNRKNNETQFFSMKLLAEDALVNLPVIEDLRVDKTSSTDDVLISFTMVCDRGNCLYPALRVFLFDGSGKVTRSIPVQSEDYQHGSKLTRETISLRIQLRPLERSYTVEAVQGHGAVK